MEEERTLSSDLYTGTINQTVSFLPVGTPAVTAHLSQIQQNITTSGKIEALKTRHRVAYLGKNYSDVVMPCIPAHQHKIHPHRQFPLFSQYFIKTAEDQETKAFVSGKRSAILPTHNQKGQKILLRYKGCGNGLKGFNKENNHGDFEVRGSHFFNTAKRELFMTQQINTLLRQQLGIHPPANTPLCFYQYSPQFLKSQNITNELSHIGKYCCVFETRGDRRAGTHLISPLQIIFLSLFKQENVGEWQKLFKGKERIDENGELTEFVTDFQLLMIEAPTFCQKFNQTKQSTAFITFQEGEFKEFQDTRKQIIHKIVESFVPQQYKQKCLEILTSIKNLKQSIKAIVYRIGWEMGRIKMIMSQNGISWGFFLDHGKLFHCNAHLNNFIVTLPEKSTQSSNYFILPLDYDLAYHKQEFINIEEDSNNYGERDDALFENYQCAEYSAMEVSLFGLEIMDFKYGIGQLEGEKQNILMKKMNRIVFRDSLVQSFHKGMRSKESFYEKLIGEWDQNIEDIRKLIECCLMISINFQT